MTEPDHPRQDIGTRAIRDSAAGADLVDEVAVLRAENARLRQLLGLDGSAPEPSGEGWSPVLFSEPTETETPHQVDAGSDTGVKVRLFRSLFAGRDDVFALRWDNSRTSKSGWSPAVRGGWSKARQPGREYLPLTDEVLHRHLAGELHAGLYPVLRGDGCRLLAADFDGPGWLLDALAYLDAATAAGAPSALERSRSGAGGHVWTFFSAPVPASSARRIGIHLLREAMTVRAELDLASYDRLFPAQDFLPKGSFGNLIALPLQGECRRRGTTVFLDRSTLEPHDDQWAFLASLERLSPQVVSALTSALGELAAGPDVRTYRRPRSADVGPAPPPSISAVAGAMLGIDRVGVPPALLSGLKHLASLHNPDFYEKEKQRFSTWNTPRFVRCYRETLDQLLLPRGLRAKAEAIVAEAGSRLDISDGHRACEPIQVGLVAHLTAEQQAATEALVSHHLGTLVGPPGSGKTVVGCSVIAHHRQPTLIIVDRKPLMDQWKDRLVTHLGLEPKQVGRVGGRTSGIIDLAMVQSLSRRDDIPAVTAGYGLVIVDECHHVPAVTFERAVREIPAPRWLGLTATPYRRDGLQAMMAMHCGPIRHRMSDRQDSALRTLDLIVHETDHPAAEGAEHIQTLMRDLVQDERRTGAICDDIAVSAAAGRNCLVLTRWKEHLDQLAAGLVDRGLEPLLLYGGLGKKARASVILRLADQDTSERGLLLCATASLLGEGFDCPPLDTLFLAFPVRFKGDVVQYVGRVLRPTDTKIRVEVHDYVDSLVPQFERMHRERRGAYASLGFRLPDDRRPGRRPR